MPERPIVSPNDHDVLSGRGNFVNSHFGNINFRSLVTLNKLPYVAADKRQKCLFATKIVDEIKKLDPPGRFLAQDSNTKLWYELGEKKILAKTRQALREGAPEFREALGVTEGSSDHSKDEDEKQADVVTQKSGVVAPSSSYAPFPVVKLAPVLSENVPLKSGATNVGAYPATATPSATIENHSYPANFSQIRPNLLADDVPPAGYATSHDAQPAPVLSETVPLDSGDIILGANSAIPTPSAFIDEHTHSMTSQLNSQPDACVYPPQSLPTDHPNTTTLSIPQPRPAIRVQSIQLEDLHKEKRSTQDPSMSLSLDVTSDLDGGLSALMQDSMSFSGFIDFDSSSSYKASFVADD